MEREVEERFERIEKNLETASANLQILTGAMLKTNEMIANVTQSVASYVDASDARMKQIEANLDGLIRAITREHTNGKGEK